MRTATERRAIDAFADAGVVCAKQGVLDQALDELVLRLEIEGAGDLLDDLIGQRWEVDPRFVAKRPVVPKQPGKPPAKPATKPTTRPTRKGTR